MWVEESVRCLDIFFIIIVKVASKVISTILNYDRWYLIRPVFREKTLEMCLEIKVSIFVVGTSKDPKIKSAGLKDYIYRNSIRCSLSGAKIGTNI